MPIQLVDNFQVNVARPIDSRIVASGSVARDAIQYKYEGLRVFDTSDGVPYVWRNGAWSGENSSSITGNGTANYLVKYNTNNTLANSVIFENSTNILIGTTTNNAPAAKLQVAGNIRTTGVFVGDGSSITNLNASNIATGTMSVGRLNLTGSNGFMLVRNASTAFWEDPNNVTVSNSNKVKVDNNTGTSIRYVLFYDTSGTATYRGVESSTTKSITIVPSTGNVGINLGATSPATTLDVNGTIRIRGGSPADKSLLMSDANGLASWKPQNEVSVPVGTIIMWGGPANQIPTNWKLCDGAQAPNTSALYTLLVSWSNPFGNGTAKLPDLRERFVIGAGGGTTAAANQNTTNPVDSPSGYSVGAVGGNSRVTLTRAQLPKHTHKLDNGVDGAVMSNPGNHTHSYQYADEFGSNPGLEDNRGSNSTQQTGGAGGHTHTGNTGDGTTDGLNGQPHENRPPYFALCYIIKIN